MNLSWQHLLAFLVAVGILVTVHEFGHYWVARRLGFKVLRFSVGFGKALWTRRGRDADRVEYVIAAIPLGGYVKMLDEREGAVDAADLPRAFERAFLQKWLDTVVQRRPALLGFDPLTHERRVKEFCELDRLVLDANRSALVVRQRRAVQERIRALRDSASMQFLRGQMVRQRGHAALRRILHEDMQEHDRAGN